MISAMVVNVAGGPSLLHEVTASLALTAVESGVGLVATGVTPGHVACHLPLRPGFTRPDGRVHPTVSSAILDAGTGLAVFPPVDGFQGGVTAELRVDNLGVVAPGASRLEVVGSLLSLGPEFGVARAELRDDLGNLVAHAIGVLATGSPNHSDGEVPLVASSFDPMVDRLHRRGDDCAVADITGAMLNRRGAVHGGVLMGLAYQAQEQFLLSTGAPADPLQMTVEYLRPASAGGALTLRSSYVRRGRRVRSIRTEIADVTDKLVAIASGTHAVRGPGQTATAV